MISANNFGMVVLLSLLMISLVSADIGSMTAIREENRKVNLATSLEGIVRRFGSWTLYCTQVNVYVTLPVFMHSAGTS